MALDGGVNHLCLAMALNNSEILAKKKPDNTFKHISDHYEDQHEVQKDRQQGETEFGSKTQPSEQNNEGAKKPTKEQANEGFTVVKKKSTKKRQSRSE